MVLFWETIGAIYKGKTSTGVSNTLMMRNMEVLIPVYKSAIAFKTI